MYLARIWHVFDTYLARIWRVFGVFEASVCAAYLGPYLGNSRVFRVPARLKDMPDGLNEIQQLDFIKEVQAAWLIHGGKEV